MVAGRSATDTESVWEHPGVSDTMTDEVTPLVSTASVAFACGAILMIAGVPIGRDVLVLAIFAWLREE